MRSRVTRPTPLSAYRDRFLFPQGPSGPDGPPAIYLAGQSLGLQATGVRAAVERQLDRWAQPRRRGPLRRGRSLVHLRRDLPRPDVADRRRPTVRSRDPQHADRQPAPPAGLVLPARGRATEDPHRTPRSSRRTGTRSASHLAFRGLDPVADLIVVGPRTGEDLVRVDDLEGALVEHGPTVALALFDGVNFATGQALPIGRLTAAAHDVGAIVGLAARPRRREPAARPPRRRRRLRRLVHLQVPQRRSGLGRRDLRPRPPHATRCRDARG